MKEHIN